MSDAADSENAGRRRSRARRRGGAGSRLIAMIVKEFKQMRRDRLTLAIMVGVPVIQMLLFGYAINLDPRHLPTAVVLADDGPAGRGIVAAMQTSGYFEVTHEVESGEAMIDLLQSGAVQFGVEITSDFTRRIVRGDTARLLLVADDTDPAAVGGAVGAMERIVREAIRRDLRGTMTERRPEPPLVEVVVQRRYNPDIDTAKVIVPGLLGVILLLSLLINTALAVTRERERGTMEQLLSMPLTPLEIMVGKIVPYILIGAVQTVLVLGAAWYLFGVPMRGDGVLLIGMVTLFIVASLAMGYLMSTVAKTQLQAMQMTIFFFLPNLLLSGFAFPFRGMPDWAQWIGEALPLTHFIRVVRGVMLKGADADAMWRDIAALGAFTVIIAVVGLLRFRRTLD